MKEMIYTEEKKDEFVSLASQHEDNVLKFMMQFFSEDILPFLGIEGKVVSAAPTESISASPAAAKAFFAISEYLMFIQR